VIAAVNLWRDASQRSVLHLWNWLARFFLIIVQIMLLVQRPGRSLGLDAILLRREQQLADNGLSDRLVRVLS
jgi:hypothetical protein